jgi:hypothetical protein
MGLWRRFRSGVVGEEYNRSAESVVVGQIKLIEKHFIQILCSVKSGLVLNHPLLHILFCLAGVVHYVNMSLAIMRFKRFHPLFKCFALGFMVAQIAFKSFHNHIQIERGRNNLPQDGAAETAVVGIAQVSAGRIRPVAWPSDYPAETAEAFCEGHVTAFAFFGGIPLSILYDNTRLAAARSPRTVTARLTAMATGPSTSYPSTICSGFLGAAITMTLTRKP